MTELEEVSRIVSSMGADSAVLADRRVAHVVAVGLDLVSQRVIPGVDIRNEKTADGLVAQIKVKQDAKIANPIHLCIAVLHDTGRQRIQLQVRLADNSAAKIVAHCFFPRAQNVEHIMDASIEIHSGAELHHTEGHYHGPFGGVTVLPTAKVRVHPHGHTGAIFLTSL